MTVLIVIFDKGVKSIAGMMQKESEKNKFVSQVQMTLVGLLSTFQTIKISKCFKNKCNMRIFFKILHKNLRLKH